MTVKKLKKALPGTYAAIKEIVNKEMEKLRQADAEESAKNAEHVPIVFDLVESNNYIFITENGRRVKGINVGTFVKKNLPKIALTA